MSRKTRSISFNTNDYFENMLYEESLLCSNFSGLMKKLYLNHIKSIEITTSKNVKQLSVQQPSYQSIEQPTFDTNLMKQFI